MIDRLDTLFSTLRAENRAALVTYVMAGDPDFETALAILCCLPGAGADVIELGLPFTDPMADGPAIQAAGLRALAAGQTTRRTLDLVAGFRAGDAITPVVLMGYLNPIHSYGVDRFLVDAAAAGVDGFIVVDLPPEMDDEFVVPALAAGFAPIRLATPTTDAGRLPAVLANTAGFLYYVSITGVTGTATPDFERVGRAVAAIKAETNLPVVVGFGVKTAEHARTLAGRADGVVVGSALVDAVRASLDGDGRATAETVGAVRVLVGELAGGVRSATRDGVIPDGGA